MDPNVPADRIAISLICFAILLVVLAAIFYVGMVRERARKAEAKVIREGDRAFQREMTMLTCDAIRSENLLRIAAEEARLYGRNTRASE